MKRTVNRPSLHRRGRLHVETELLQADAHGLGRDVEGAHQAGQRPIALAVFRAHEVRGQPALSGEAIRVASVPLAEGNSAQLIIAHV